MTEPENLLGYGSIATAGLMAGMMALLPFGNSLPAVMYGAGIAFKILQLGGWAATIGIGITSRFRAFRLMGWCTAVAVTALFAWKRLSGLPPYSFFGVAGALGMALAAGNLLAWWFARRRSRA